MGDNLKLVWAEYHTISLAVVRGAMTFSITTLSTMTLSIKGLFVTLSINDIQHKRHSACQKCHYAEYLYAECQNFLIVMMNVIILSVIMLNVVGLSVVMMNVALPCKVLHGKSMSYKWQRLEFRGRIHNTLFSS
jgi:hypothetical protein